MKSPATAGLFLLYSVLKTIERVFANFYLMKNISIKDIALEVGVSTTTVSFVLNGKAKEKRISDDLNDRILKAAARLNYRPNQVARGLRTGQTHTIGLIVEDIANPFFAHLARFVESEADRAGYTVMFCSTENNDEKATNLLYILRHRQMDGFIIIPTPGLKKEIQSLVEENKPVVLVDRYFPDLDTSYVTVDNFKGALGGVNLLIAKGYKKIGLVTLDSMQVQMMERERGFTAAMEKTRRNSGPELILRISYDLSYEETVKTISSFLQKDKGMDGLFFTTNYLGVAGLEAIRNIGKKIPKEIGMVCFDDSDLFRLGSPAISVVAQPIREIGEKAVDLILDMLKNRTAKPQHIIIEPLIIEREST
jgi:LacI family transcriptional regulator